jgi:hypothetical protein
MAGTPRPPTPIATVARHASRPVALAHLHKPRTATLPMRLALAPGNLKVEVAAKRRAHGSAYLEHQPKFLEHRHWGAPMPLPPGTCGRFCYQHVALAGEERIWHASEQCPRGAIYQVCIIEMPHTSFDPRKGSVAGRA